MRLLNERLLIDDASGDLEAQNNEEPAAIRDINYRPLLCVNVVVKTILKNQVSHNTTPPLMPMLVWGSFTI